MLREPEYKIRGKSSDLIGDRVQLAEAPRRRGPGIREGAEFRSTLYSGTDEKGSKYYSYGTPKKGFSTDTNGKGEAPPKGTKGEGDIHSHGDYDKRFGAGNDRPSPEDFSAMEAGSEYVVTPSGWLVQYSWVTDPKEMVERLKSGKGDEGVVHKAHRVPEKGREMIPCDPNSSLCTEKGKRALKEGSTDARVEKHNKKE